MTPSITGGGIISQIKSGFVNGLDRRWTKQWCLVALFVLSLVAAALIIGMIMLPFLAGQMMRRAFERAKTPAPASD